MQGGKLLNYRNFLMYWIKVSEGNMILNYEIALYESKCLLLVADNLLVRCRLSKC